MIDLEQLSKNKHALNGLLSFVDTKRKILELKNNLLIDTSLVSEIDKISRVIEIVDSVEKSSLIDDKILINVDVLRVTYEKYFKTLIDKFIFIYILSTKDKLEYNEDSEMFSYKINKYTFDLLSGKQYGRITKNKMIAHDIKSFINKYEHNIIDTAIEYKQIIRRTRRTNRNKTI